MASSGTIVSWKSTGSADFGDGDGVKSYAGAHYSFEWTSEKLSTPGQTKVTYNLYRRGRNSSPKKLYNRCVMTVVDSNGTTHRSLDTGTLSSAPGTQFNDYLHESGSFVVNHNNSGAASFTVNFQVAIYSTTLHSNSGTGTLDTNVPTYTIEYSANGGSNAPGNTVVVCGSSFNLPNSSTSPTPPTGYHAENKWNRNADESGSSYSYGASYTPTSSHKLYAELDPNTYSVKYNGNGSTSGSMSNSSHTYDTAKTLTSNAFSRSYKVSFDEKSGASVSDQTVTYTFKNWNTNSGGTGTTYTNAQSVKNLTSTNGGTVNLYAQWNPTSITLPTTTRAGYLFRGWSTSSSATTANYQGGDTYTPTAATTLYAVWQKIDGYDDNIIYVKVNGSWVLSKH